MNKTIISLFIILILFTFFNPALFPQKSPDDFFGLTVGADRTLVVYPDIIKYFKHLDKKSPRIKLTNEGLSTLKNPIHLAFISSEKNIQNLPRLIELNKKLADPTGLSPQEARAAIGEAKAFVLITATIHATEIGASQMAMIFAHKLAQSNDPETKKILDNVVILLMPSINPDGNIIVTKWYEKQLNTPYEGSFPPFLYHHYAGHDNNRDFYMLNLDESRVVNAVLHHRYFPQVFLDMHQMGGIGPRMFVPPFKDPFNQNLSPIMLRSASLIGTYMAFKLQTENKPGVVTDFGFDAYWPGGSKNTAWYKNVVGLLTELASVRIATPVYVDANELQAGHKGLAEYKAQVNFPDPWEGGWWRLKDIIDYEMTAAEALIELASTQRKYLLENFYAMANENIKKGETEKPYGYAIPMTGTSQWDLPGAYTFLQKMQENGVKLSRFKEDVIIENTVFKKGDYYISMAQPYRAFIKAMMEIQRYPEIRFSKNGSIMQPYDSSGWTMPLQMGVKYRTAQAPPPTKSLEPVETETIGYPEEKITGEGGYYVFPGRANRSFIAANRLLKKKKKLFRCVTKKGGLSPGDFVLKASQITDKELLNALKGTGVQARRQSFDSNPSQPISKTLKTDIPLVPLKRVTAPTIAIYQSYRALKDEGWTRWVLDRYEFPYTIIHNADFKKPSFPSTYDVLIIADMERSILVEGKRSRPYYLGRPSLPPEYSGGIGKEGIKAIVQMAKEGGTVILMDSATQIAAKDFELPIKNILHKVPRSDFSCPGSLLRINVDPTHPLGWGMERDTMLYFSNCAAFQTGLPSVTDIKRDIAARYQNEGPHLLSGFLKGGEKLNRAAAIVRFKFHKGNVILLGGRVQHRAQTFGTFKFLFNAIYY